MYAAAACAVASLARAFLFLSCGRWPHYHQETDTPDRLNFRKMYRVQQLAQDLATRCAMTQLDPGHIPGLSLTFPPLRA